MHITDLIKNRKNSPLISIEIVPPEKGSAWEDVKQTVETFQNFGISWASVTSHAHERALEVINGNHVLRTKKKRLDTNSICLAMKLSLGVEIMPHLIVSGFSKDETEDALLNMHFFGIDNLLALRGDRLANYLPFKIHQLENNFSADLVEQIVNINEGKHLDEYDGLIKTNFCIGVGGYPEKHYESPDFETDLRNLKLKVDKGADFIITQMFFDNDCFYRFVSECRKIGISIPIIPGIKPLYRKRHLTHLPKIFHVSVPKKLEQLLDKYQKDEDFYKAGTEYTIDQCLDLIAHDVPALHFYTMNQTEPLTEILEQLKIKN